MQGFVLAEEVHAWEWGAAGAATQGAGGGRGGAHGSLGNAPAKEMRPVKGGDAGAE